MKRIYLLVVVALLLAIPARAGVVSGEDTVRVLLPVSDCLQRAQIIKDAIAARTTVAGDVKLNKRVTELEVVCDSIDTRLTGISSKLETKPAALPKEEIVVAPVVVAPVALPAYVIQLCALTNPMKESVFNGKPLIMDRVGELYRYCLGFDNFQSAQATLPEVKALYPDAFVRVVR